MKKINTAIIMAGGKGTRLNCKNKPKPMVVLSKYKTPALEFLLRNLKLNGINTVYISIDFHGEVIEKYFGNKFIGLNIKYIKSTDKTLEENILYFKNIIHKPIFLIFSDIYSEIQFNTLSNFLLKNKKMLLCVKRLQDTSQYGKLFIAKNSIRFLSPSENNGDPGLVDMGIHIITPDFFRVLEKQKNLIEAKKVLFKNNEACLYEHLGFWIDFGTTKRLSYLRNINGLFK